MNKSKLNGMTINERLFSLVLLDDFDQAIQLNDKEKAISILKKAELSAEQALETVSKILDNSSA